MGLSELEAGKAMGPITAMSRDHGDFCSDLLLTLCHFGGSPDILWKSFFCGCVGAEC